MINWQIGIKNCVELRTRHKQTDIRQFVSIRRTKKKINIPAPSQRRLCQLSRVVSYFYICIIILAALEQNVNRTKSALTFCLLKIIAWKGEKKRESKKFTLRKLLLHNNQMRTNFSLFHNTYFWGTICGFDYFSCTYVWLVKMMWHEMKITMNSGNKTTATTKIRFLCWEWIKVCDVQLLNWTHH